MTAMASGAGMGKVRAAVFEGAGQPFSIREFSLPELRGSEVLARIRCATICGSDLHSFLGHRVVPVPSILGHEMVAEIAGTGPDGVADHRGNPLGIGDRITWSMVWSCGECPYCGLGLVSACERLMKFGHELVEGKHPLCGGFSEYCVLPEKTAIFRVPETLSDAEACPANCATATVAAAMRKAGSMAGQSVLIFGAGMLGLTGCAMAAVSGADPIIVLEPDGSRREWALKFGAAEVIDSTLGLDAARERVLRLTDGRGAEVAFEFSGAPAAAETSVKLMRFGGRIFLIGAAYPGRPLELSGELLVKRMLTLSGVYNYGPSDLEFALNFLVHAARRWPFGELVPRSYRLEEINEAFAHAVNVKPPRVALRLR